MNTSQITIIKPDDFHLHIREHAMMTLALAHTSRIFARAIIMPNLGVPVTTAKLALSYRDDILGALPENSQFEPLMTVYLTDNTSKEEIRNIKASQHIHAVKYYPAGATTNSDSGVTDLKKIYSILEEMEKQDVPLLVHGEVTDPDIDIFDREKAFIDRYLTDITRTFPLLRVVFEHITTNEAVHFVLEAGSKCAATITAHHLTLNRNAMFKGGIRPHHYCLPVLKRETHRAALVRAATSGNKKFFLGTDSAPHTTDRKQSACGCAGIYTAHAAMELYAEVFEKHNAIDKLEGFSSKFGADFYYLPYNKNTITITKSEHTIADSYPVEDKELHPFMAGETLSWQASEDQ